LSSAFLDDRSDVDASVKTVARSVQTDAAQAVARNRTQQTMEAGWSYDVFWCRPKTDNQLLASKTFANLGSIPNSRLRLREWSKQENARPGYQIKGLQIRAETYEQDRAEQLRKILKEAMGVTFDIQTASNATPNYLSVFVCN
jgi:hypothetical protein